MSFTEVEIVEIVQVPAKRLRAWVRKGWIRPEAREGAPVFAEIDVARVTLLKQLCDDLEIEEDTVAILISLLDQVHSLRRELKALAHAVEHQPEPVRADIARLHHELMEE
jgi:chaperone modulatory protein CbpM